jgi:hypothetical protein
MEQFDKIIKEKIGEKEFPFRMSAWKKFCVKAGIKHGLSTLQLTALISGGLLATGGGVAILYHHFQPTSPKPTEIPVVAVQNEEADITDTSLVIVEATPIETAASEQPVEKNDIEKSDFNKVQEVEPIKAETIETATDNNSVPTKVPEGVEKPNNDKWKISIINPDTIKEN